MIRRGETAVEMLRRLDSGEFIRSPAHLAFVRGAGCGIPGCWRTPVHAHHVRTAATAGTGIKSSDAHAVGLCFGHHFEGHQKGWKTFQRKYRVNLAEHAAYLASVSPALVKLRGII